MPLRQNWVQLHQIAQRQTWLKPKIKIKLRFHTKKCKCANGVQVCAMGFSLSAELALVDLSSVDHRSRFHPIS